jgi:ubiquinone/menaquinone biosynthesis C-methylase UbiE
MNDEKVCPVEKAGHLDKWWRKLLQNPKKLLSPHIKPGMNVLDFGCGPGFFTITAAQLVGDTGKVVAADLQQGMLDILDNKLSGSIFKNRVVLHKCESESIGLNQKFDFIYAVYVVHETPDPTRTLQEMYDMLEKGSHLLIIDPKMHLSKQDFEDMLVTVKKIGFKIIESKSTLMDYYLELKHQ